MNHNPPHPDPVCPHGCLNGVITDRDLGGDGTSSYCPIHGPTPDEWADRMLAGPLAEEESVSPDPVSTETEERWTIEVCPKCQSDRWDHGFGLCVCLNCGLEYGGLRGERSAQTIEVVPASRLLQVQAQRDEARAEVRNRDALLDGARAQHKSSARNIERLLARAEAAEGEIERLREALDEVAVKCEGMAVYIASPTRGRNVLGPLLQQSLDAASQHLRGYAVQARAALSTPEQTEGE